MTGAIKTSTAVNAGHYRWRIRTCNNRVIGIGWALQDSEYGPNNTFSVIMPGMPIPLDRIILLWIRRRRDNIGGRLILFSVLMRDFLITRGITIFSGYQAGGTFIWFKQCPAIGHDIGAPAATTKPNIGGLITGIIAAA